MPQPLPGPLNWEPGCQHSVQPAHLLFASGPSGDPESDAEKVICRTQNAAGPAGNLPLQVRGMQRDQAIGTLTAHDPSGRDRGPLHRRRSVSGSIPNRPAQME